MNATTYDFCCGSGHLNQVAVEFFASHRASVVNYLDDAGRRRFRLVATYRGQDASIRFRKRITKAIGVRGWSRFRDV
jgi:hypothetical protein